MEECEESWLSGAILTDRRHLLANDIERRSLEMTGCQLWMEKLQCVELKVSREDISSSQIKSVDFFLFEGK